MEPKTQQPKEQEDTVSALNAFIEALNIAKEVSSITPAKAVFGTASILLAMIRVSPTPYFASRCWAEMALGRDGQSSGLRRARAGVRQRLPRPQSWIRRKELERAQQLSVRGNKTADGVSHSNSAYIQYFIGDFFNLTSGLWQRSSGTSSSRENGIRFLELSMQGTTRTRLRPGGWTSSGSFKSSTCVPSFLDDCR